MTAWRCSAHAVWLALLLGGCAALPRLRGVSPEPAESDARQAREVGSPAVDAPRIDRGRTPLGFVLESALHARRRHPGQPDMVFEIGNGATVIDGDRLQVSIRTSQDAYLYLAFCSRHASDPRYAGLKVFPDEGALQVMAQEPAIVPDRAAEIVLDDHPGQEALYLILSRSELSSADSELAQVIAAARQGSQSTDCGAPLRAPGRIGSGSGSKPSRLWNAAPRSRTKPPPSPGTRSPRPKRADPRSEKDPVVEIQRGGDIVWNNGAAVGVDADPDGIVILRFSLTHVAGP